MIRQKPPLSRRHNTDPDEIPFAFRNHSLDSPQNQRLSGKGILAVLILITSAAFISPLLLRRSLQPLPVPGLQARLSTDGRLLGHFPYPEADSKTLVILAPGMQLKKDAAINFLEMQRAAATAGVKLNLISAFRPVSLQQKLFFEVKANRNQSSIDRAKVSAPPGFSEHSTGYAIDLGDLSQPNTNLSHTFISTRAYQWLKDHAARFHFVLSFPERNPQGVSFEPWHWRFEGNSESLRLFEPAHRLIQASGRQLER